MTRPASVPLAMALLALAAAAAPLPAAACGGFYGAEVQVDPDQEILVIHRGGVETYVFRPRFCGRAAEFGVILPIPAVPNESPSLERPEVFEELDRFAAPSTSEVCGMAAGFACGGSGSGGGGPPDEPGFGTGVDVVDGGRVGIFEWALLQATSVDAFTGWLGANGFPHDPSDTSAYDHYVAAAWYFVAFKVSAGAIPPAGKRLCGDLGPIRLSFPAPRPVVPARIASVNAAGAPAPTWRVFVIAAGQKAVRLGDGFASGSSVYFAGWLRQAELGDYPELAALSLDGERLTALDVAFPPGSATGDIVLEEASPYDHRGVVLVRTECGGGGGGCAAGGSPTLLALLAAALLLWSRTAARGARRRPRS